jgi:hypothetical protein
LFGAEWTPVENLNIGFGLNFLLDSFLTIDVKNYQVDLGGFWNKFALFAQNGTNFLGALFTDTTINLTVSYKY